MLDATTVADARDVYRAIRMAGPGGLGTVPEQDVADEPTETLLEAMRLGAAHDDVAREYATNFDTTFEVGLPTLQRAARGRPVVGRRGRADLPDDPGGAPGHPHRPARRQAGGERRLRARGARAGTRRRDERCRAPRDRSLDESLRDAANTANPGTTADLVTASIFALLVSAQIA